jgi:negative regulator of sigma E activity
MTNTNWEEQLSALMDDELSEEDAIATIKAITQNPALMAKWRRMQAISAALTQVTSQNTAIQNEIKTLHNKRSAQLSGQAGQRKPARTDQKTPVTDTDPTSVA